ncbi:MAG TPA: hypothetical protein DCY79_00480 [Planctomycetaceae bacterium]|nr:hypothetical protein [Planctomycetaceae bacterium]
MNQLLARSGCVAVWIMGLLEFHAAADEAALLKRVEVPAGFEVELAAGPPLVKHPLMACLDDRGRLFIAESAGRNLRAKDLEKELPNFVRMLEDTDGDGKFDKSTIFADQMTLPQGALWHDNALYVASPPHIWRLEDTDGDGVCDRRTSIVSKFGYTGNAASVHGCFLGPFGRIYWCEGRHGHEFTDAAGNITSKGKAARIFSCLPDGSDVQIFCGGGMDNPVEIDWTADGEMIGTCNLFYRQRGDCLVHWVRGGVYPRYDQQACIDEFPTTGAPLTEVHNFGHVAVSGMTRYRDAVFGAAYRDNVFVTHFNTHQVVRVVLQPDGSTYTAKEYPFLTIHDDDSHPTDVLQDADGSLLVIDTGGWFRIGCPTSQIAKPNIQGAIYRIRKRGAKPPADPRGLAIDWERLSGKALLPHLKSDSFVVREKAVRHLARKLRTQPQDFKLDLQAVDRELQPYVTRILAHAGVKPAAGSAVDTPLAFHAAAARRAPISASCSLEDVLRGLQAGAKPGVRRSAASLVGRLQVTQPEDLQRLIRAMLQMLVETPDRHLEHTVIYALIERDDPQAALPFLTSRQPAIQRAVLLALDQMPSAQLTREQVAPLLRSADITVRNTAIAVMRKHPDWVADVQAALSDIIAAGQVDEVTAETLVGSLVAFAAEAEIQQLILNGIGDGAIDSQVRGLLLEALGQASHVPLSEPMQVAIREAATAEDAALVRRAVATMVSVAPERFVPSLRRIAQSTDRPDDVRITACQGLVRAEQPLGLKDVQFLTQQVRNHRLPMLRLAAAQALGDGRLDVAGKLHVTHAVANSGPLELRALIGVYQDDAEPRVGQRLVQALGQTPAISSLGRTQLARLLDQYPDSRQQAATLLNKLSEHPDVATLDRLLKTLGPGDQERGKLVFTSQQASCASCHRIGKVGAPIGPDLSTIGARRTRRDLLEAILFPSVSFARGFETVAIATEEGQVLSGMITHETATHLSIRTTDQRELRLARNEVESLRPGDVSVMPQGLAKTLTEAQLSDLLAYLQSRVP